MQIFVFLQPMWLRNKAVFLILQHSSLRGLNRKNTRKNMKFWPLNPYEKRSDWKPCVSGNFSEPLTSTLWNKKKDLLAKVTEMEQNELCSYTYDSIKNYRQINLKWNSKKKWGRQYHTRKPAQTNWSKTTQQFSVNSHKKFLCQYQVSKR